MRPITRLLWPIPLLAFFIYPYTKRFTPLCHYWLGLCLGLAPVGGWVAVGGPIGSPAPWVLGMAVLLWTAGFDIIYATQDVECDVRDGVHSMPADYGVEASLVQTRIDHVLTIVLLAVGGWLAGAGWRVVRRRGHRGRAARLRERDREGRRPLARECGVLHG